MPLKQNIRTKGFIITPVKIGLLIIVMSAAIIVSIALLPSLHKSNKAVSGTIKTMGTLPSPTNPKTLLPNNTENSNQTTNNSNKTSSASQPINTTSLVAPYGSFVSNHKPGQNGSDLTELSQCITTPGASCRITFTLDGITKTLANQTVDSSGSTFWEWNVNDAGLTKGSWTITALSSLNGQTKSTTDQLKLDIQ